MSFGSGYDELFTDATALKSKMDKACDDTGRDPATLRHSFLMFDGGARESGGRLFYWGSPQAFADIAGAILDLGFDEIGVYYPIEEQRDAYEAAAADVIPALRS